MCRLGLFNVRMIEKMSAKEKGYAAFIHLCQAYDKSRLGGKVEC